MERPGHFIVWGEMWSEWVMLEKEHEQAGHFSYRAQSILGLGATGTDTKTSWVLMEIATCLLKTSRKGHFHTFCLKLFILILPLCCVWVSTLPLLPDSCLVKNTRFLNKKENLESPFFVLEGHPWGNFADDHCHRDPRAAKKGYTFQGTDMEV